MALAPLRHQSERIDLLYDSVVMPDIVAFTKKVAYDALREEVARGFDDRPIVITDRVPGRSPEAVKPFGRIQFDSRSSLFEIVEWVLDMVWKISPVGRGPDRRPGHPGLYRGSHVVMVNGDIVTDRRELQRRKFTSKDKILVVNTQPYARKLEGATARKSTGRGRRKPSSRQAPNGVYRFVYAQAKKRFGRLAWIDYKNVPLKYLGVKVWGDQGGRYEDRKGKGRGIRVRKRALRDQVYPAIQISRSDYLSNLIANS